MTKKVKDDKKPISENIKSLAAVISALTVICTAATGCAAFVANKISVDIDTKIQPLATKIDAIEMDTTRIQLIDMIREEPDNEDSILKLAKHYFVDLSGDWYATALFNDWCAERDIHVDWQMPI